MTFIAAEKVLESTDELGELFYKGSPLDDYCSHISRNLCILAIADYMTRRHIQSVQVCPVSFLDIILILLF